MCCACRGQKGASDLLDQQSSTCGSGPFWGSHIRCPAHWVLTLLRWTNLKLGVMQHEKCVKGGQCEEGWEPLLYVQAPPCLPVWVSFPPSTTGLVGSAKRSERTEDVGPARVIWKGQLHRGHRCDRAITSRSEDHENSWHYLAARSQSICLFRAYI